MADTQVKPPGPDRTKDEPVEDGFGQITSPYERWAGDILRREQGATATSPEVEKTGVDNIDKAAAGEAAPSWKTSLDEDSDQSKPGRNGSALKWLARRGAKRWLAGGLVALLISLVSGGSGLLGLLPAHIHSLANTKAFKFMTKAQHTRTGEYRKTKYFINPDDCSVSGARCRFHQGLSDNEIKALERVGLKPEVGTSASGKKYILEFRPTDIKGVTGPINASNFSRLYGSSPDLLSRFNRIAKPTTGLTAGRETLKHLLKKFPNLNLTDPMGTRPTDARDFRRYIYGESHLTADTGLGSDVNDQVATLANERRELMLAEDFAKAPTTLPLADAIDVGTAPDIANALGGSLSKRLALGFIGGALTIPDSACTVYGLSRALVVMSMIYKHKALALNSLAIQTVLSKTKAGDASHQETSLLMNSALKPSTVEASRGKTFFDSEGWFLLSEGKIRDPAGLSRWAVGGSLAEHLVQLNQTANSLASSAGINLNRDCLLIKSFVGQALLFVTGVTISFLTLGSGAVAGVATSTTVSIALAIAVMFAIPSLISYFAGTISPDLTDDPEGGYGVGNAFAAGWLALSGEVGKANGMQPMKADQYENAIIEGNTHARFMAQVDAIEKSPFSLDNPDGLWGKVVLATLPYTTSVAKTLQGGLVAVLNPFSMISSAYKPGLMTNPAYAADEDPYGSKYCQDEDIQAMGLATDAFCNILYWQDDSTMTDPKYLPDPATAWMVDTGQVNPETGEPASQDFRYFIADCITDDMPMLPDGGGGGFENQINSAGGQINTTQCRSSGERETYYRAYIQDTGIDAADSQGVDGTFGKEAVL